MNKRIIKRTLQKVAKRNGVSVAEVRREIGIAISAAQESLTPKAREKWGFVSHKGKTTTPEELVARISGNLLKDEEVIHILKNKENE